MELDWLQVSRTQPRGVTDRPAEAMGYTQPAVSRQSARWSRRQARACSTASLARAAH
jgi:hypothetical protein